MFLFATDSLAFLNQYIFVIVCFVNNNIFILLRVVYVFLFILFYFCYFYIKLMISAVDCKDISVTMKQGLEGSPMC